MLTNGDFSAGNSGFHSDYTFVATNHMVYTTPPDGALVQNPSTAFTNGYVSYTDHTGDAAGLMLFFDGAGPNYAVWSEQIPLAAGSTYTFTYYATMANGRPVGSDQADLSVQLDGMSLGDMVISTEGDLGWTKVTTTLTPTTTGPHTLSIYDLNGTALNNDGTIDDLDLEGPAATGDVPEPASWALMLAGFGTVGAALRRRCRLAAA